MSQLPPQAIQPGRHAEPEPSTAQTASPETGGVWVTRRSRGWRHALLRRILAFADLGAAFLGTFSLLIFGGHGAAQFVWSLVYLPAWILVAKLLGLYDRDGRVLRHLTVDEVPALVLWALIGTSGLSFFLELTPVGRPQASTALVIGLSAAVSSVILRGGARLLWRIITPPERVVILGDIANATAITRKLELFPDVHMNVVAVRDWGDLDEIRTDIVSASADRLIVVPTSLDDGEVRRTYEVARETGVKLSLIPPSRSAFGTAVRLEHLAELPVLEFNTADPSRSTVFLKRTLDVTVSGAAFVVLLPLFAIIALAIKLDGRGPVFFSQWRAGQNGRPFRMRKFRTMVVNAEELLTELVPFDTLSEPMFKLHDDPRVTRVGRLLRRWSLDELPQFLNVLKGDMSLVGPRPEQLALVDRYTPEQRVRLAVKPGLTGPMQVYGRGALMLEERLAVECAYIENLSIGRDLRIIAMTIACVFHGRGAY